MSNPDSLYCLKCRSVQALVPESVKKEDTKFESKKGLEGHRATWVAICAKCGKPVRQFTKGEKKPEEEVAPVVEAPKAL